MSDVRGYPRINAITHRECAELFFDDVVVQEKIDGSQFRFFVDPDDGVLRFFSKNREQDGNAPDAIFKPTVEALNAQAPRMVLGRVYCGEAMARPKHNVLAYERAPKGHIVLFDVFDPDLGWLSYDSVVAVAKTFDVDVVPVLHSGKLAGPHELEPLLKTPSILGGIIEGVVVKNYARRIFGKLVADQFREVAGRKIPRSKDGLFDSLCATIAHKVASPARLTKQRQHLRDDGRLTDSPQDIGPLIKMLMADVEVEAADVIKDELFAAALPIINKKLGPMMACWYKERLAEMGGASEKWREPE